MSIVEGVTYRYNDTLTVPAFEYPGLTSLPYGTRADLSLTDRLKARDELPGPAMPGTPGAWYPLDYADPARMLNERVGVLDWDDQEMTVSEGGPITLNSTDYPRNVVFRRRVDFRGSSGARNCAFLGSTTENRECIGFGSQAVKHELIDCTIFAQSPNWQTQGVKKGVGELILRRCDVYGVIDGIAPSNNWSSPLRAIQTAVHDLLLFSPDPGAVGGMPDNAGHVDAVQNAGGWTEILGCDIRAMYDMTQYQGKQHSVNFGTPDAQGVFPYHVFGNKYREANGEPSPYQTSVLMLSPRTYPLLTTKLNFSRFDGASFAVNGGGRTELAQGHVFEVIGNLIGKNHRLVGGTHRFLTVDKALQAIIRAEGNVDAETGAPVSKAELF